MKTRKLKKYVLLPLTLAIALLLGAFIFFFYRFQEEQMRADVVSRFQSVEKLYTSHMDSDACMLSSTLHPILHNEKLKATLKTQDRRTLLELARPLFEKLHSENQITHFYFTGPDRVNILRVHKPEKHGDRIDRFTTMGAEKTGKCCRGIELGPLGTFTLRAVEPWFDGKELIGYVELGEEIEHIIEKVRKIFNVETHILIDKRYLNRENWEAGMRMMGRNPDWNQFSSVAIIYQSMKKFPESLAGLLPEQQPDAEAIFTDVSFNDRYYHSKFIHLKDVGGRAVGDMVVMYDVTDLMADMKLTISVVAGVCVAVGGILFVLFDVFTGRVEQKMEASYQEIIRISKAVESTSDAILITDTTGKPIYINKAFIELSGYTMNDLDKAGGLPILFSDRTVGQEVINIITKGLPWTGESEMQICSGRKVPVLLRANGIKEETGDILGLVSIYVDIAERKRAEEQRLQSEKLQGVIEMAGAVCHELNQPMQVVSACSELLIVNTNEGAAMDGNLKTIKKQIHRMGKITRKLMKITKYETKNYMFEGKKIIDIDKASENAHSWN